MQLNTINQNISDTLLEIEKMEKEMATKSSQAATWTKTANTQDNYVKTKHCSGTKKKKDACNAEKRRITIDTQEKRRFAATATARANDLKNNIIPGLRADLASHNAALAAYNASQVEIDQKLAGQGKTRESVIEDQKIQGEIDKVKAVENLKTEKTQKYVILGLVTLGVLTAGYIGFKKLRGK